MHALKNENGFSFRKEKKLLQTSVRKLSQSPESIYLNRINGRLGSITKPNLFANFCKIQ
jgi:hypothetical protein